MRLKLAGLLFEAYVSKLGMLDFLLVRMQCNQLTIAAEGQFVRLLYILWYTVDGSILPGLVDLGI